MKASSQLLQFAGRNQVIQVLNLLFPDSALKPSMEGACTKVGETFRGSSKALGRCWSGKIRWCVWWPGQLWTMTPALACSR